MKQSELVITVANLTGLSKSMIQEVLETASEVVADVIRTNPDEGVAFPGLGKFSARERQARMGRNPRNGDEVMIAGKRIARFRPALSFAGRVAGTRV